MPSGIAQNPTAESITPAPDLRRDLISPRQLAAELHMCVRTLQRLHDARTGPPRITLGKHIYYRRAAVSEWLARVEGYGVAAPVRSRRKPFVSSSRNARRARRTT